MPQAIEEYKALLEKARTALPENAGNRARWSLPEPDLIKEGRMTILRNFRDIVGAVRRDDGHVVKYLLTQLATAGNQDGDRVVFVGRITPDAVRARLDDYVATYVTCSECGSPDTKLVRHDRVQLLKCEACGAQEPVKARKGVRKQDTGAVKEGAVFEVTITGNGKRGEGFAQVGDFRVVIPKTPEGTKLKVRITRVSNDMAFAEPA